jgi:hypothetical protein
MAEPGRWHYDAERRRWTFRGYGWEARLTWLPPGDHGSGIWHLFARHEDGDRCLGGGIDGPRKAAMDTAEEVLKRGTWRDAS